MRINSLFLFLSWCSTSFCLAVRGLIPAAMAAPGANPSCFWGTRSSDSVKYDWLKCSTVFWVTSLGSLQTFVVADDVWPDKSGESCRVIKHNIIWANQMTEYCVYRWLCTHSMFDLTCFPAIVWASDFILCVLSCFCEFSGFKSYFRSNSRQGINVHTLLRVNENWVG